MKTPKFWHYRNWRAALLLPVAWLIRIVSIALYSCSTPYKANRPVICVGNVVAGGAGKTPLALLIAKLLSEHCKAPHFISRGYGGKRTTTPVLVTSNKMPQENIGDEPILLAKQAPCWVCADKTKAAISAINAGADVLILDDGLQNPNIKKDISILVIDGEYGIGNGWLLPAGPLRESLHSALKKADAIVIIAPQKADNSLILQNIMRQNKRQLPIFNGYLQPTIQLHKFMDKKIVAFAGIGRPEKFFNMLTEYGLDLAATINFADHHMFNAQDIAMLKQLKRQHNALLFTTEKDAVRLPVDFQSQIVTVPVSLEIKHKAEFCKWLLERLA